MGYIMGIMGMGYARLPTAYFYCDSGRDGPVVACVWLLMA